MSRIRTFVAVDIEAAVRRRARELIQTLGGTTTAVRWVDSNDLHLTLKFLGDVEDKDIYSVCQAVGSAVCDLKPFHAFCRGVSAFPSLQRPRTIWLGLEDPAAQLTTLQGRVEEALANLGFPRKHRKFCPHVTIGRVDIRHRRVSAPD